MKVTGAPNGENRELGAIPGRTRHCKDEPRAICHWGTGKVQRGDDSKSGDLPVTVIHGQW